MGANGGTPPKPFNRNWTIDEFLPLKKKSGGSSPSRKVMQLSDVKSSGKKNYINGKNEIDELLSKSSDAYHADISRNVLTGGRSLNASASIKDLTSTGPKIDSFLAKQEEKKQPLQKKRKKARNMLALLEEEAGEGY